MGTTNALIRATDQPALDRIAEPLSKGIRQVYESAGPIGNDTKNALHGVWLGHPLHPVFTDVPVGAWTTALALDCAADGDPGMRRAATFAFGVGLLGALGAAVTGLTDWSETDGQSRRTGLVHGLLNIAATSLIATAYLQRRNDSDASGRAFAWTGYGIAVASAYLGGDLVYGQRIGVTHADQPAPDDFVPVADSAALAENAMMKVRAGDADVLLVRQHGHVCARPFMRASRRAAVGRYAQGRLGRVSLARIGIRARGRPRAERTFNPRSTVLRGARAGRED